MTKDCRCWCCICPKFSLGLTPEEVGTIRTQTTHNHHRYYRPTKKLKLGLVVIVGNQLVASVGDHLYQIRIDFEIVVGHC